MAFVIISYVVPMEMKQNVPHLNPNAHCELMSRFVCASTPLSASKSRDRARFIIFNDMLDSFRTEANDGANTMSTTIVHTADEGNKGIDMNCQ